MTPLMPFRTSVTIVASPRPRVGKTLLARLLAGFHLQEGRAVAAFDLNDGEDTLAQFAPKFTSVSSIAETRGQMALFDRLVCDDDVSKIVDLGHSSYEAFFQVATQIGFAEEASRRNIAPVILFVSTPDATSVESYRRLLLRFPLATVAPVANEMFGAPQPRVRYPVGEGGPLRLPVLAPSLRRTIETPPFDLTDEQLNFVMTIPPDAVTELRRWLRRTHLEFRELYLRVLLAELRSAVRF